MMQKTLIVMMGIPASGKTSYAKSLVRNHKKVKYISRDEVRFSLLNSKEEYFAKEKLVYKTFIKRIRTALSEDNEIVIVDATHINEASRDKLFNSIYYSIIKNKVTVKFYYVDTPVEECIKRNAERTGRAKVPEKVIMDFEKKLTLPTEKEMRKWNFNSALYTIGKEGTTFSTLLNITYD